MSKLTKTIIILVSIIGVLLICFLLLWSYSKRNVVDKPVMINNQGWKMTLVSGNWKTADDKYQLAIDGTDFTLTVDSTTLRLSSFSFSPDEQPDDYNSRFNMVFENDANQCYD